MILTQPQPSPRPIAKISPPSISPMQRYASFLDKTLTEIRILGALDEKIVKMMKNLLSQRQKSPKIQIPSFRTILDLTPRQIAGGNISMKEVQQALNTELNENQRYLRALNETLQDLKSKYDRYVLSFDVSDIRTRQRGFIPPDVLDNEDLEGALEMWASERS